MPIDRLLDQQWQHLVSLCESESKFLADGTHPRLLKLLEVEIDSLARAMGFSEQRIATRDFRVEKDGARILRILAFAFAMVQIL
jgi:hypothetical protein